MKAIVFNQYGSPDVLELVEVEKPTPKENEVLVKIHAASANPLDWHRMRGAPFLVRLSDGLRKPKNSKIGADLAGRVEAVGKAVTQFKVGDDVYGDIGAGGFAEYVCVTEKYLAPKPDNITFEEAAAIPVVALTALQGLRDAGEIQAGQKVLINGASGGVGTIAVQLAKHFGTEVTGVCSTRNVELVRSIGADHVIDYTQEDFTNRGEQYDLIYDAVGNRSAWAFRGALRPNGKAVIAGFTTLPHLFIQSVFFAKLLSALGNKSIGMMGTAQIRQADLLFMNELLASGEVRPVIDRRYPLSETPDGLRYLETMRARGKVIINIAE